MTRRSTKVWPVSRTITTMPDQSEVGIEQLPLCFDVDNELDDDRPVPAMDPEVIVRTSRRRRKTAAAHWDGSRIIVSLPAGVDAEERTELVDHLVRKVESGRPYMWAWNVMLQMRGEELADKYLGGIRPASIRWVNNQSKRWGSCSAQSGEIRISHRLRMVPEWVLDATLVHELAHLLQPNHSAEFHVLANRYPRQQEAALFLEGYSLGLEGGVDLLAAEALAR